MNKRRLSDSPLLNSFKPSYRKPDLMKLKFICANALEKMSSQNLFEVSKFHKNPIKFPIARDRNHKKASRRPSARRDPDPDKINRKFAFFPRNCQKKLSYPHEYT